MDPAILQGLIGSGPLGIVCWLMLRQIERGQEARLAYDRDRLETDKQLVAALTELCVRIRPGAPGAPS